MIAIPEEARAKDEYVCLREYDPQFFKAVKDDEDDEDEKSRRPEGKDGDSSPCAFESVDSDSVDSDSTEHIGESLQARMDRRRARDAAELEDVDMVALEIDLFGDFDICSL